MMQRFRTGLLIAFFLALPLLAGRLCFDSFGAFPHNDDFLYARCSQILVEQGRYEHVTQYGSLTASVAGHSIWGAAVCAVLGFSYANLHLSVAIAAWVGALCVYGTSRRFGVRPGLSLLLAMTLTVSPYIYGMSFTFMTDVTATVYVLIAVWAYTIAIQNGSVAWHLCGGLAAAAAMWTRQTHLVVITYAFVGIFGSRSLNWQKKLLHLLIACGLPIFSYVVYDMGWLLPGNDDRLPRVGVREYGAAFWYQSALYAYQATLLTGLVLLPLMPILVARLATARRRLKGENARVCRAADFAGTVTVLALLGLFLVKGGRIYITQATGYIMTNAHFGPILLADQMDAGRWSEMDGVRWSPLFWQALTVAAIILVGVLVWFASGALLNRASRGETETERARWWCQSGMLVSIVAATVGMIVMVETLYDRYWMLFYPFVFAWLASVLRGEAGLPRWAWVGTCVLLLAMFSLSFVFTHDFLAWNKVRGEQVQRWLEAGLEPVEFDAGNGINGWYRTFEDLHTHKRPGDTTLYWRGHAHVALSIGPRPGWQVVDELPWRSWAVGKTCKILVIRRVDPNALPGP